jgi:hypothetical protein
MSTNIMPTTISLSEIKSVLTGLGWSFLGEGNYNLAFRSKDGLRVFKIFKGNDPMLSLDLPERGTRLWNELYAEEIASKCIPAAEVAEIDIGIKKIQGWYLPYTAGRQSTDEEMQSAIIDIYNRTGRIVIDVFINGNCITMADKKVIVVDTSMALLLQQDNVKILQNGRRRSNSEASLYNWPYLLVNCYQSLNQDTQYPKTVHTLKALLFLQRQFPEILEVSNLKKNEVYMYKCAQAYEIMFAKLSDNYIVKDQSTKDNHSPTSSERSSPTTSDEEEDDREGEGRHPSGENR